MIKIGKFIFSLLTALMVVACSPGGGDIPSPGPYDDNSKPNNINDLFEKQENISTDQMYKSANYILAEIFDVYTIEYFDELLGEIHDSHNDVYNMISGRSDR